MLARAKDTTKVTVVIISVILILLPLLPVIGVFLWIIDIPRKVGQKFEFEEWLRRGLYLFIDPTEMRLIREGMLEMVMSESPVESDLDRWGLLREIDIAREEIEQGLKNGEYFFSFVGATSALLVGEVIGIAYGGVGLTLVTLGFSLLVAVRVIVIDGLSYRSVNHRHESARRLALLRGWNKGPVHGSGAIGIAVLALIASRGGLGYRLGMEII